MYGGTPAVPGLPEYVIFEVLYPFLDERSCLDTSRLRERTASGVLRGAECRGEEGVVESTWEVRP